MMFYVCVCVIVGFSLLYYGYGKKKDYEIKMKELELQEKKIELDIKNAEVKENNN